MTSKRAKKAKAKIRSTTAKMPATDGAPWPYVEVQWHDATSESCWRSAGLNDDLPNASAIITRGWLVRTTKVCITIAASVAAINPKQGEKNAVDVGEIITIPRGCVLSDGLIELSVSRKIRKRMTLQ